jgi:hypothetical protein
VSSTTEIDAACMALRAPASKGQASLQELSLIPMNSEAIRNHIVPSNRLGGTVSKYVVS